MWSFAIFILHEDKFPLFFFNKGGTHCLKRYHIEVCKEKNMFQQIHFKIAEHVTFGLGSDVYKNRRKFIVLL